MPGCSRWSSPPYSTACPSKSPLTIPRSTRTWHTTSRCGSPNANSISPQPGSGRVVTAKASRRAGHADLLGDRIGNRHRGTAMQHSDRIVSAHAIDLRSRLECHRAGPGMVGHLDDKGGGSPDVDMHLRAVAEVD